MRNIKKLLSIVMVLAMVLSLGASALAATVTITPATGTEGSDMGTSYSAWQIFGGTTGNTHEGQTNADGVLDAQIGDIVWGAAIGTKSADFVQALIDAGDPFDKLEKTASAKDVAELLGNVNDSAAANLFAQVAYDFVKRSDAQYKLEVGTNKVDPGYYIIVEDDFEGNKVINPALLQLTDEGDVTIKQKADIPKVEKTVDDVNDTTGNPENGQKSADYDIGDHVPYTLTATLGEGYDLFETYFLTFEDTMTAGLTYDNNAKVYVDSVAPENEITGIFTITPDAEAVGATLTVHCDDLKATDMASRFHDGTKIIVTYTATLNTNAVIGGAGNPNTVVLKYERNPHNTGDGESKPGETPPDTAIVFTFDQKVNKVDGNNNEPLKGAQFKLVKRYAAFPADAGETPTTVYSYEALKSAENGAWFVEKTEGKPDAYLKVITTTTIDDETVFNFDGIDDGEYILVETIVPNGYNRAADIEFRITAEHKLPEAEGASGITTFKVEYKDADDNWQTTTNDPIVVNSEKSDGMLDTTVVNNSGLELPETGGIGTTIFYVVGAILVAGAVILLVSKKRASGAEK